MNHIQEPPQAQRENENHILQYENLQSKRQNVIFLDNDKFFGPLRSHALG